MHSQNLFPICFRLVAFTALCMAVTGCLSATALGQLTESQPNADAIIHLRVSQPATPVVIPETLFGSFLEPIGHSTYGGLWADVVENPSFEEGLWSARNVEEMVRQRPELRRASELGLPYSGSRSTRIRVLATSRFGERPPTQLNRC